MRKNQLLSVVMALFTVWLALISAGLATLSTASEVYAHGVAVQMAKDAPPPTAPDLGRFKPYLQVPQKPATAWTPQSSTAVASPLPTHTSAPQATTQPARTPGEQKDMRTATSSTFLNKDGTWTLRSSTVPVHYQDAQGNWQDIDTTVVADSSDNGFSYVNRANSWRIHFAKNAGSPHIVHGQINGSEYFESISDAAAVDAVTNGSQTTYPGIFSNVDAVYTLMHAHMEETFLLHSADVPTNFTLTYHVPGATAQQDSSGNITFTDAKGAVIFGISAPGMFESYTNGQTLPNAAGSSHLTMTLSGAGPNYTVTLTPDAQWLHDPARKFPVAVDPTFVYSHADNQSNTTDGQQYGDTTVESNNPNTLFYNLPDERVGNCSALPSGAYGNGTGTNRAYLKFWAGVPLVGNTRIVSATLSLYQVSWYAQGTQLDVSEVKGPWNELATTWNNQPGIGVKKASTLTNSYANNAVSADVSDIIYDWWQDGQPGYGIALSFDNESVVCDRFNSDDAGSNIPAISTTYVVDSTPPTGSLSINASNAYKASNGAIFTNSRTVSLSPTFTDSNTRTDWASNWKTLNGVTTLGWAAPNYTLAADGAQVTADTSTCGVNQCYVETYFNKPLPAGNSPAYTAMFKWDGKGEFYFGAASSTNGDDRIDLVAEPGVNGFNTAQVSLSGGATSFTSFNESIPFNPNTWYFGQVSFPRADVGELYVWQVGAVRPSLPSAAWTGVAVPNPGLNFWEQGSNGSATHSYTISNVTITDAPTLVDGYGDWGIDYSNDNSSFSCPAPVTGTWCVGTGYTPGWTLTSGDGPKTVYLRGADNVNEIAPTSQTLTQSATVNLDQTPPTSSITSPAAGREVRGAVTVSGLASDPAVNNTASGLAKVTLYVDGTSTGQSLNSSSPSFTWDTTGVAPGPHVLSFVAIDNLGNSATSAGVTVDVANTGQSQYNTYAMRDLPDGTSAGANVANGDAVVTHSDLDIAGRGPDLAITRTYNGLAQINNLFGWGWTSELDEGLIANSDGSVTYRDPDGGLHIFLSNGSGGYLTSPGLYLTLTKNTDGTFTLTSRDQSKTNFNSAGYITSVVDRNGNALSVTYSGTTPTTVTDAAGRALTLTVSGGHVTKIVDPGSRSFTYAYDGSNNLISYTDPAGTVMQYSYDGSHHLTQIVSDYLSGGPTDSQTNVTSKLAYDSEGRLSQLIDPMGFDAGFSYGGNPGSLQTQVVQLQTNANTTPSTTSSVYETSTYTLAGDGSGAVTAIQEPSPGGQVQYQYNSNEQVTQVTEPGDATNPSKVTAYTYDASGNQLTQTVDPNGMKLQTTWTYDSANNVLTETDPAGIVSQYTYDSPTAGDALTVIKNYVSGGATDRQTNVKTSYTYDSSGEVLTETDPLGVVTHYTYDTYGDVSQTVKNYVSGGATDSQTNVLTSSGYNALGEKLTSTDELGVVTQYTYDALGDVTKTIKNYVSGGATDSQTNVTSMASFDALGRQVTETNPRGFVSLTVYDADGRVIQTTQNSVTGGATDAQTNVSSYTYYDAAGNATKSKDMKGNTTTTTYDGDNRATEVVTADSSGAKLSDKLTGYDIAGQVTSSQIIDGKNNPTTSYTYDAAGRQATQADPPANPTSTTPNDPALVSNVTTTTYDLDGNAKAQIVTNANVAGDVSDTTMTYDNLGRTISKVENANTSSAQTTSYTYDAAGHQLTMTQPATDTSTGAATTTTTTITYDKLGRTNSSANSAGTTTYTYDGAGHTLSTTNSAGTTTDTYDYLGRVSTETKTDSANVTQSSVSNSYDNNGNLLNSATSYGSTTSVVLQRSYDALDRAMTLNDGSRSYVYDTNGNVTNMAVNAPNNGPTIVSATYTYDGANRLGNQTDTIGSGTGAVSHSFGYLYSAYGDRTTSTVDGVNTTYTYDQSHQMLSETSGSTTTSYAYDGYNNRTQLVSTNGTTTSTTSYTYDSTTHTELVSKTDPDGKITAYTYDTTGNLKKAVYDTAGANQTTTYTYDTQNRLTGLTRPDGTQVAFTYDANGQRTSVSVTPPSGGAASVVKDVYQLGHLAYQTDGAGTLLASFTYDSQGIPVSVQVGSDPSTAPRYYYVYNAHGDVTSLTDTSGAVVASYLYDSWGALTSSTETFANGWSNPYRYDGRDGARYDASDGLYWLSVRAYDPTLGRFLSRDPLGRAPLFGVNGNPYVYAGNNPLSNVDPSGQRTAGANAAQVRNAAALQAHTRVSSRRGSSSKQSHSANPSLPWWLKILVSTLTSTGMNVASIIQAQEADALAAARTAASDALDEAVLNLRYMGKSWQQVFKSMAFRRGNQQLEAIGESSKFWDTFGKALWLVGGAIDWGTYFWAYLHSNNRPDLTGWTRVAVAIYAGLIHAFFVTAVGYFVTLGVSAAATPIAGVFVGIGAGWLASNVADQFVPSLIAWLIPKQ